MKDSEIKKMPQYMKAVEVRKADSIILTERPPASIKETPFRKEDRNNVEIHLAMITGGADGYYIKEGQTLMGFLKQKEQDLRKINKRIVNHKQKRINEGHAPGEAVPAELLDRKIQILAKKEVYELEQKKLETILQDLEQKREEETSKRMLKGGLGKGKIMGGILVEMDGQKCAIKDGVLHIDDKRSPYDGMPVHRYRSDVSGVHGAEWSYRTRMEHKRSKQAEDRFRNSNVKRPSLPKWNKETDKIEYNGYSDVVLKKLNIYERRKKASASY